MVRCKFKCTNIEEVLNEGARVVLEPVTHGSKENEEFFKYTPYGRIEFGTINIESAKQFEVGKEYYIDISLAIQK